MTEKISVPDYLSKHQLREIIEEAVNECYNNQSEAPLFFFRDYFNKKTQSTQIEKVVARQVIDSRGNPTVEVDVIVNGEVVGRAAGPSGASTGSKEALELRDGDKKLFGGKSVFKAVENVNTKINESLKGKKLNLKENDKVVLDLDGTEFKKNLGGNAITATSFALAYAGAKMAKEEPFIYLAKQFKNVTDLKDHKFTMPRPMVNIINGGEHAGSDLKIQEFMIVPKGGIPFTKTIQMITEVYHCLKKIIVEEKGVSAKNVGDEGGFAPNIKDPNEALTMIEKAIKAAGYVVGEDIGMALDAAASEFYDKETKKYEVVKGKHFSSSELVDFYVDLCDKHPGLISIEDSHDEEDYLGFKLMTEKLGSKIMVVGDDLYTTNPNFIKKGIEEKWANALLLKVNQIGAISEAMEAAKLEFTQKHNVIVSHRSGETATSLISDLVVAIGGQFIKTGAPCRGERTVKYNRLLQIEEVINKLGMNSLNTQ